MCWHLAAVQARTSFSMITEKWEAWAVLQGGGKTEGCPLLLSARSMGSPPCSLQETAICQRAARKIKLSKLTHSGYWSPFLAPKTLSQHQFRANSLDADKTQWGIFCAWHSLCTATVPDLGTKRSILWKCESNITLQEVSAPISHSWLFLHHWEFPAPSSDTVPTALSRLGSVHPSLQWFPAPNPFFFL